MGVSKHGALSFPSLPSQKLFTYRKRIGVIIVSEGNLSTSNAKKARLSAQKKERIKLPNRDGVGGDKKMYHISEFLNHPSGVEAIINAKALQSFQSIDSELYRCTLPQIQLLNFEVSPVMDLRVCTTHNCCTVEMLSCKFEGSDILEQQNEHFSASMTNRITWDSNGSETFLDVNVKLNVTLEIYTKPFTLLPVSAIERPGNLVIQALVDRLVPLLLQQLLEDYDKWFQKQHQYFPLP